MRKFLLLVVVLVIVAPQSKGQRSVVDSLLSVAEQSFNNGAYEAAELLARRLLENQSVQDTDRIACERIIASALVAQGRPAQAREHFTSILKINPSFELDPILTSPKILSVFVETKRMFTPPKPPDSSLFIPRKLVTPSLSYRAVMFPGWEQVHQGRTTTGVVLATAGVVFLGSGIAAEFLRSSSRKDYLAATSPADIADKYKVYDRYHHLETYSFMLFALTYVASEVELFTVGTQTLELHSRLVPTESTTLTLTLRF